jgi:hypothetical protein
MLAISTSLNDVISLYWYVVKVININCIPKYETFVETNRLNT